MLFWAVALLIAGFIILIKGADLMVSGASSMAKKFGISAIAIGLTVVSFGTSAPELIVSLLSAVNGKADASFGNVIGSNNFNLFCILGVSGLIYPLVVQRNTVKFEVPISIAAILILYVLVNDRWFGAAQNILSRYDAVVLLVLFITFMMYVYRTMKKTSDYEEAPIKIFSTPVSILLVVSGLVMLVLGGKLVVDNAVSLANYFGLSQKIIGLTILATGTSLPELATSAVAAYKKNTDIAIGNVVGSNIFNIFFILGVTGAVQPMHYNDAMNFDLRVLLAGSVILMIFMFTLNTRKLDRWEAFLLFTGYIVYTVFLIGMEKSAG
ncbi:MAG: K+-dependent Na+/Ca+ exchanger [Cyclobacteriaceae bacterium]|nr:MAG: K+-dependent Na+/Ca+ exchanger [Cyclobacteriaceae bacterium]